MKRPKKSPPQTPEIPPQNLALFDPLESPRLVKDEMNLVEHPFGSLSKEKDTRVIRLEWTARHPVSKKELAASWQVIGHAELGLPTANDERVYLVAMELTRESAWQQRVHFTRADFLKRLGWTDGSESYRMLLEAFERLRGVQITARNAFYEPSSGYYLDGGFGLLDTYLIAGEGPGRRKSEDERLPTTYFTWNDLLHRSMVQGNIRTLDFDFALSLERPLSMRLFRYLDMKRYDGKVVFEIGLRELCEKHLGMIVEGRYDSQLRQTLAPAHAELCERGFIREALVEKMKTRKGLKISYFFTASSAKEESGEMAGQPAEHELQLLLPDGMPPVFGALVETPDDGLGEPDDLPMAIEVAAEPVEVAAEVEERQDSAVEQGGAKRVTSAKKIVVEIAPPNAPEVAPQIEIQAPVEAVSPVADLVSRLVERGVTAGVASELCGAFGRSEIELQLECVADRAPKSAAATLVKAIRGGWAPPQEFLGRKEAELEAQNRRMAQESQKLETARRMAAEGQERASEEQECARLDAIWEGLEPKTREKLDVEARGKLGILGNLGRGEAALKAFRRAVMRDYLARL